MLAGPELWIEPLPAGPEGGLALNQRRYRGRLQVLGHEPDDVRVKARIGYLPEESYLYRFLTAEETLDFYGRLFDIEPAERRRRAAELIERVGLQRDRKRQLREYSKGMRQRIKLAQALLLDPELLLLDEPAAGVPSMETHRILDVLDKLPSEIAILIIEHDMDLVFRFARRITVLTQGAVLTEGTPAEISADTRVKQVYLGEGS